MKHCNIVDVLMNMQIINSVVYDKSKGSLYKQIKSILMGEHAFPLAGFVCKKF